MKNARPFQLHSQTVGALPLVNHFLSRLRFSQLLANRLPPANPRSLIDPAATLTALLRCLILRRSPLYSVIEWASPIVPELLGCTAQQLSELNDDRIGRALDRLFDADRSALLTDSVLHMIREFAVSLQQFHNDSTSITLHGQYMDADGKPVRGKLTLKVLFGHNKEHRPDLKQLLWILTVTDEAVPIHFKIADGNTQDSRTHLDTWRTLRELVGNPTFLYVADSKLCSRSNLRSIQQEKGRFITVLPRTRKEDAQFKAWIGSHAPDWQQVVRYPHPRLKDGPEDIVQAVDSPFPDPDGYRLIWFHSSLKADQDAADRQEQIARAITELGEVKQKVESPRSRLKTREGIAEKVEQILKARGVRRLMRYAIEERQHKLYRQEKRGRAGEKTRWRRLVKLRYSLSWEPLTKHIEEDSHSDGIFPLLTNCRELSMQEVLEAYRCKQPLIEKRHALLKNVLEATPVFLKSVARLEAFLFLEYVAMTVHALIERELRAGMAREKIEQLPIYPEERDCKAPTAARVFETFGALQRHFLMEKGKSIQTFQPELTEVQKTILRLLGLSVEGFMQDLS